MDAMTNASSLRTALMALLVLAVTGIPATAQTATTVRADALDATVVLILRHAETSSTDASPDPPLSETGRRHARKLVDFLEGTDVAAVYSSQFRRTRETARPLAEAHGVPVTERSVSGANIAIYPGELAEAIRENHQGEIVVVVSHSNLVPAIVEALGGTPGPAIAEDEYDRLYVVVREEGGTANTLRVKY